MRENLWQIEAYYGDRSKPPRRPGLGAFRATNRSEAGARIEAQAARARPEIGEIVVTPPEGVERPAWADEVERMRA